MVGGQAVRRSGGGVPVAHEIEQRHRRDRRAPPVAGVAVEAVVTDGHDRALGRHEGQLGEAGSGEVGPDARRGVGWPPVPGPDDVAARTCTIQAMPGWCG